MLNKYFVLIGTLNAEGNTSAKIDTYDDFDTAEIKYCDALSQYRGNAQVAYAEIKMLDMYMRPIGGHEFTINKLPKPEPNAE